MKTQPNSAGDQTGRKPDLEQLIAGLMQPSAYSFPVDAVDVRQTHISVVFLAGASVFKLKKPVKLPFLDFSTLELRRFYCEEEVRLNRRLAPNVYRGVTPIRRTPIGLRVGDGDGEIVEWAVEMTRLPDQAMFATRMEQDTLTEAQVEKLARRIADFHQQAMVTSADTKAATIAANGHFDRIAKAVRDNIEFAEKQVGRTISAPVFHRLRAATEQALSKLKPLIERRVTEGMIRDLHGDLHLDHVYLFEDKSPPSDLVIVDCIEFNEAFRFIDVVADMAFCTMDFQFHGRRDFARTFSQAYFAASSDALGRELLPFYTAYRAAVRGKVDGILATESEVPDSDRKAAAARSSAYWLLALGQLEPVEQRPVLVLVSGLPGTGKSTLSRGLVDSGQFHWIRSDAVRKELAGEVASTHKGADYQSGIYTPQWTDRTYSECLRRAMAAIQQGERVLVDASFVEEHRRSQFLQAAIDAGAPAVWLVCQALPRTVHERLAKRQNDVSDADWTIYQKAVQAWQPPSGLSQRVLVTIGAEGEPRKMVEQAMDAISKSLG